jgi:aryl-alcohol dehydrogenase-like predicted oxidoreductase
VLFFGCAPSTCRCPACFKCRVSYHSRYARRVRDLPWYDRGDHVTDSVTDRDYDLLDELQKIAKELSSTVAAVSFAWVQSRPRVTSTIIGARTMKQLDSNLAALDLPLSTDHIELLDNPT